MLRSLLHSLRSAPSTRPGRVANRARLHLLTLDERVLPSGSDMFATATVIPATAVTFYDLGSTAGATGEPGEPYHLQPERPEVLNSHWWIWTPSTSGPTTVSLPYADYDGTRAVYTGDSLGNLTRVAVGFFNDAKFDAVAGTTYHIAVDGLLDRKGEYMLKLTHGFVPENDYFADATDIPGTFARFADSGSTVGATGEPGEPNHAGNSNPLASHWWTWTPSTSGPTRIHLHPSAFNPTLAVYTGDRVDALTEVVSNDNYFGPGFFDASSLVTFDAVAGTTYHIAVDGAGGESVDYNFTFSRVIPVNDDFADATVLDPAQPVISVSGTIRDAIASGEPGEPDHAGLASPLNSVWYRFTPTDSRTIGIMRAGNYGLVLGVYTGTGLGSLTAVDLVNPTDAGGTFFSAIAGTTYHIAVDGRSNDLGDFDLTLINTPVAAANGTLVVLGAGTSDSVTVTPVGSSTGGGTGVRVVWDIGHEQGEAELGGFFRAYFGMGDGEDDVQFAPTLAFRTNISLGEGNNTLVSGAGADRVTSGDGNDWINTGTGSDQVDAGNGNNIVEIVSGSVTTGAGNDVVRGGNGSNTINTGAGNDYADAGGGSDLVHVGEGNDTVYGGLGNDVLMGGDGHDLLLGGDGHDLLVGGLDGDELFGGEGNDILFAQDLIGTGSTLTQLRTKLNAWISGGFVTFNASNLFSVYDPKSKYDLVLGEGGTDLFSGLDDKDAFDQTEGEGTIVLP